MSNASHLIEDPPKLHPVARSMAIDGLACSAAGRWFLPSLSDVFFVALFIWLFAASGFGWQGLLFDGDIGWHIRTGEYILDHGAVPTNDLFSFTRPGATWFAWEWLSDVGFALAHRTAGLKGVVLIASVIITVWALLMLRQALWRGANAWIALTVTLGGVSASAIHFLARPHIITLLFATVTAWMMESDRRCPSSRLWWLIPLTALWTNLHGGFVLAVAIAGLTTLGSAAEVWAGRGNWRSIVRYGVLTIGCGAASLLNPYGFRLHTHIVEFLRSRWIRSVVQEFQAPTFRSENQSQFEVLLIVGLALAGFLIARRRYVEFLWILAFAHLSLTSVRNIPVYIAVASPIVSEVLSELWSAAVAKSHSNSASRILFDLGAGMVPGYQRMSVWPMIFLLALSFSKAVTSWPRDFPTVLFPVSLIRANEKRLVGGRVLTVDQWADYLIYAFYPRQKVFVDGRSDFFGPEVGGDYLNAVQGDYRWGEILDRYRVDTVLAPVTWPLATLLKSAGSWRVVADDGHAILFCRR